MKSPFYARPERSRTCDSLPNRSSSSRRDVLRTTILRRFTAKAGERASTGRATGQLHSGKGGRAFREGGPRKAASIRPSARAARRLGQPRRTRLARLARVREGFHLCAALVTWRLPAGLSPRWCCPQAKPVDCRPWKPSFPHSQLFSFPPCVPSAWFLGLRLSGHVGDLGVRRALRVVDGIPGRRRADPRLACRTRTGGRSSGILAARGCGQSAPAFEARCSGGVFRRLRRWPARHAFSLRTRRPLRGACGCGS